MPLPPTLLNRLKKRGIIKKKAEPNEEIIAESYDDDQDRSDADSIHPAIDDGKTVFLQTGAPGCPNKCNPFHMCVQYCYDHWGDGTLESRIDPLYNKRRMRMLTKYPLPTSWKEAYDPGLGRYYYWNTETEEVCWLSPTHPKAKITAAACRVAKNEWEAINIENAKRSLYAKPKESGSSRKRRDSYDSSSSVSDNEEDSSKKRPAKRSGGGASKGKGDLDPMDPASYSDVPRGKWSTGLETRSDAKTGVDTTASGPLFQQRPYPAPGAILRQNIEQQQGQKKKRKD